MALKYYVRIWIFVTIVLSYEYFALNFKPDLSILWHFGYQVKPDPGHRLSLFLGWAGLDTMLLMNIYMMRKRFSFLKGSGSLSSWLNFHIFCGLVGPTCILFHSNFHVRGLVAISFWSMVISASSGVIGRYFYVQLIGMKKEFKDSAAHWATELDRMKNSASKPIPEESIAKLKVLALKHVGVDMRDVSPDGTLHAGVFSIFLSSLAGDIRLWLDLPKTIAGLPSRSRVYLKEYAMSERRALFLEPFRQLMGHWHTFHTPFAVFMYLAAVIHVATALLLGVKH